MTDRCAGTGQPVRNAMNASSLGSKFYGMVFGDCSSCGKHVKCRKGTRNANPHKAQETARV